MLAIELDNICADEKSAPVAVELGLWLENTCVDDTCVDEEAVTTAVELRVWPDDTSVDDGTALTALELGTLVAEM